MADGYILDGGEWGVEAERLELRSITADPYTRARCLALGLGPSWRCLEVGAGSGSLAVWLADQVGDGGSVDAFDIHDHNMAEAPNLRAEVHDIATDNLDPEEYDLVCCRSLMIHLADPKAALEKMVGALRPGGKLLVEEPDWGMWGAVDPDHPSAARWDDNSYTAMEVLDSSGLVATKLGRTLPGLVEQLGLADVDHDAAMSIVRGGSPEALFWELTFLQTADTTEEIGAAARSDNDFVAETLRDPSFLFRSTLQFQSWGTRAD